MKKTLAFIISSTLSLVSICACGKQSVDTEDPADIGDNSYVPVHLTKAEVEIAQNANAFGFDVYHRLHEDKQMLVSPLSLSLALSMTAIGADGNTADQMCRTLGFENSSPEDIAGFYKKMSGSLLSIDKTTTFESANSIWVDKGFNVKENFLSTVNDYFNSEEKSADFKDPSTVEAINRWCSEKTHGKIEKMLDKLGENSVMALINAIYFNGKWAFSFNDKTRKEDFTTSSGNKEKVEMMSADHLLQYAAKDNWQMVSLPYGNGAFRMDVILPPKNLAFKEAAKEFGMERLNTLTLSLRNSEVALKMPEFKFDYSMDNLKEALVSLGMKDAFDPKDADFSKMAELVPGDLLWIDSVKQKTFIDVNTKGTEAAAVTVVEMGYLATSLPPKPEKAEFTADRPFFFVIREQSTGVILFIGQKVN